MAFIEVTIRIRNGDDPKKFMNSGCIVTFCNGEFGSNKIGKTQFKIVSNIIKIIFYWFNNGNRGECMMGHIFDFLSKNEVLTKLGALTIRRSYEGKNNRG